MRVPPPGRSVIPERDAVNAHTMRGKSIKYNNKTKTKKNIYCYFTLLLLMMLQQSRGTIILEGIRFFVDNQSNWFVIAVVCFLIATTAHAVAAAR